jgi:hypothetical protein
MNIDDKEQLDIESNIRSSQGVDLDRERQQLKNTYSDGNAHHFGERSKHTHKRGKKGMC